MIGVFDSGVGGLSVLRAIRAELPEEPALYLADQAHVPYGPRPREEVRGFATAIARRLISRGARMVVVACNTASAAALAHLRESFPGTPFVGMEPAVKPAAEQTRSGVVGVLATPATFQSELYASVVGRFAAGATVLQNTCPGLVARIEAGDLDGPETRRILEDALRPMREKGADVVVLGCTHYPFVLPLLREIAGPGVRVIDPAPAVAREAARRLAALAPTTVAPRGRNSVDPCGPVVCETTGDPDRLRSLLPRLLGEACPVRGIPWEAVSG